ncbi:MAG: DUF3991 domain-containing protein [Gammaproteobacteria bacterium]|nr:DUF3991 domain-containing protein [Gammaproteobacteria bacterium]
MSELEAFKSKINLTEYAAAQGYRINRKKSSRHSAVMRHDNGDKIIIARGHDGHWIYFSVRDDSDNGTIIDFIQNRRSCKLGGVRQELRPWIGEGARISRPRVEAYMPTLETSSKDRARVVLDIERMHSVNHHPYLEKDRRIPAAVLGSPRFTGKIYTDGRQNAIFPHYDKGGLCGYEIKNRNFTGFAKGGDKGLWFSAARKGDLRLIIAESAIDAISYAILHLEDGTRYASIGGKMNPGQPALIKSAIERMPAGAEIIAATDNDPDGRKLAEEIETITKATGRADLIFKADPPAEEGADWNERLTSCPSHPAPGPLFGQ